MSFTAKYPPASVDHSELLEALAALEHRQWVHWSQAVASRLPPEVAARWREAWVPYTALPDHLMELDRVWARQVLELLRERRLISEPTPHASACDIHLES